ncbi:MAG: RNA 2',3'-cyclic phosphodiesterase [Ktedonobacteraceae bacterium]
MTRTFIALELNEALQHYLSGMIRQMASALPGLRWVDPLSIHLTLAFLGELTDEQLVEAMQTAMVAAQSIAAFDYRLAHVGIFGSQRQPRVIWIGIEEPSGTLLRLHRVLNRELEQRGFAVDTRPFSPHFTLSLIKVPLKLEEVQTLQRFLDDKRRFATSPSYHVSHINVMKSELLRTGAKYVCLKAYPLY